MILTDDNLIDYKKHYQIPDDFFCYRESFPFGTCPAFRRYWKDDKGRWYHDTDGENHIYIDSGVRFAGWQALKIHLAEAWRPQAFDDRQWYCEHVA